MTDLLPAMAEARGRFMDLVAEIRPDLHRYCVRMMGSVFDAEDVVQDALAKGYYALAEMDAPPPLRPWLFRIAHNAALDALRRHEHRKVDMMADLGDFEAAEAPAADGPRVEAALEVFAALPPVQRSALALKDVLDCSLEETAAVMGTNVQAVKAALFRARANVVAARSRPEQPTPAADLARLRRYADLFNARDWDRLRALFGEETRLDLASRLQRRGAAAAEYFTQYAAGAPREELHAQAGFVDGLPAIAMFRPASGPGPAYFVTLTFAGDHVALVRDYRYVPYIARDASFTGDAP
ncbi:MAG: putative polymerase sigma subunit [Labilithrix sp.]|nr:putative polymerase sigma subunit [Labilithrix sp.]